MFNVAISKEQRKAEAPLVLPIQGGEHAPRLLEYLRQQGVQVQESPVDPEAAVLDKSADLVLRVPADYPERWQAGRPALLELIVDKSRQDVAGSLARTQRLLQGYGQQTGAMRLQLRGVNPLLARAVAVNEIDLSTPQSRGARLTGTLPFFLLVTVFMGGMYLAIDATSGEKERLSLEPLLINPVPRWQIMLGKVLAATLFSAAAMVVGLVGFHYAMGTIPVASMGLQLRLGWSEVVLVFFIALPLSLVASCLQCIIAAFARGFREAQGLASLLVFIPMLPSFWLIVSPSREEAWMSFVPLLSQVVMINSLIRGEGLAMSWLANSWLTTLGLGVLLCFAAASLYNRPRMILSG
jgi:sodium transport system permease protein